MDSKNEASEVSPSLLQTHAQVFLVSPAVTLLLGQALTPLRIEFLAIALPSTVLAIVGFALAARAWKWALLVFLSGGALLAGYFMHEKALAPKFPLHHLRSINNSGNPMYVEAVHYREPERLPDRSRWYLRAERIWYPDGARETEGHILVTVQTDRAEWRYGDRVRLWLRMRPPRSFGNPGSFDYESYLARRRIYLTANLATDAGVELLHRKQAGFWSWVEHSRREIGRFFERYLAPNDAALLKALVVGDMGGITRELRERSTAAGVAHILSISGLHVGMLGLVIFFLVRAFGSMSRALLLGCNLLKISTFFSFVAVLLYTCLAGAMVPTVRSAIMIGVYEFAVLLDREEEVFTSLSLAALIIGVIWPGVIMEISFQLSFLAVLSIVWGMRKVQQLWPAQKLAEHPKERGWLRRRARRVVLYLSVPVLATVGTGPLIAHHFGHLSLAGFVSNPVIVPVVGFAVVPVGLFAGFCSLASPDLAGAVLLIAGPLLRLSTFLVDFFSSLPLASIQVPIPNLFEVGSMYVVLLLLMTIRSRRQLTLVSAAVLLSASGCSLYWWKERWDRDHLRITHLSVGHGDAAVVEFPGEKVLVIDAGGTAGGEFDPGESIVAPFLRARKILKVDYVVMTHPRIDHYGGMKTIVQQFSPTEFWSSGAQGDSHRYHELEDALVRASVQRRFLGAGDGCRTIEGADVCIIHPAKPTTEETSLVIRLTYGKLSFLFAGDIGAREETLLLSKGSGLNTTVVKVPRHGSGSSSTEEFLAAVKPEIAVFSVGHRNPFGLPRDEVLLRYRSAGADILRTDEDGAIMFETDGKHLRYWTYRSGKLGRWPSSVDE